MKIPLEPSGTGEKIPLAGSSSSQKSSLKVSDTKNAMSDTIFCLKTLCCTASQSRRAARQRGAYPALPQTESLGRVFPSVIYARGELQGLPRRFLSCIKLRESLVRNSLTARQKTHFRYRPTRTFPAQL